MLEGSLLPATALSLVSLVPCIKGLPCNDANNCPGGSMDYSNIFSRGEGLSWCTQNMNSLSNMVFTFLACLLDQWKSTSNLHAHQNHMFVEFCFLREPKTENKATRMVKKHTKHFWRQASLLRPHDLELHLKKHPDRPKPTLRIQPWQSFPGPTENVTAEGWQRWPGSWNHKIKSKMGHVAFFHGQWQPEAKLNATFQAPFFQLGATECQGCKSRFGNRLPNGIALSEQTFTRLWRTLLLRYT